MTLTSYRFRYGLSLLTLLSAAAPLLDIQLIAAEARFHPLGLSGVTSISADGLTVAGASDWVPYLWTEAGGVETIPLPADLHLFGVHDISGDGSTFVGGVSIWPGRGTFYESFRWTRAGGYELLDRLSSRDGDWAYANEASYDGSVIVGTNVTPEGERAYRWTEATGQVSLGTPRISDPFHKGDSEGRSVSADGTTIVGAATPLDYPYTQAYRWTENLGFDVIGLPAATFPGSLPYGGANRISADGNVILGHSPSSGAWTWTKQDGFSVLPQSKDTRSPNVSDQPLKLSSDGSVLVGRQLVWNLPPLWDYVSHAAIWHQTSAGYKFSRVADVLRQNGVDLLGWHLTSVADISADGRTLIGEGINPLGVQQSWYAVLEPVPEPASAPMTVLGVVITFAAANRKGLSRLRRPQVRERHRS